MVNRILYAALYIAVTVLIMWGAIWFFTAIGLAIPAMVIQILWVIVVIICLIIVWNAFRGTLPPPWK